MAGELLARTGLRPRARISEWNGTWALALVFGLASIPWTYAFVAGLDIPLWPSFIASATYYATESERSSSVMRT